MNAIGTVLGIDFNTKAIDLVLLAEDSPQAVWERIPLHGTTSLQRLRQVRREMPRHTWYEDQGVYLAALERPYGVGESIHKLNQVFGAIVASLPPELELWEVTPAEWRQELGLPGNASKAVCAEAVLGCWPAGFRPEVVPQDALDAYAVALSARERNARGVATALEAA